MYLKEEKWFAYKEQCHQVEWNGIFMITKNNRLGNPYLLFSQKEGAMPIC